MNGFLSDVKVAHARAVKELKMIGTSDEVRDVFNGIADMIAELTGRMDQLPDPAIQAKALQPTNTKVVPGKGRKK